MAAITKISEQKKRPNRRNIYLDGAFAFGCNVTVVARFRLRVGMEVGPELVERIESNELRQECFDAALRFIARRRHSRWQLFQKLMRREDGEGHGQWSQKLVNDVLDELGQLDYVNDAAFAEACAREAMGSRGQGARRVLQDLQRAGVKEAVAQKAVDAALGQTDTRAVARALAQKRAAHMGNLEPAVARRRLAGLLGRRGFGYEVIRDAVEHAMGEMDDSGGEAITDDEGTDSPSRD